MCDIIDINNLELGKYPEIVIDKLTPHYYYFGYRGQLIPSD